MLKYWVFVLIMINLKLFINDMYWNVDYVWFNRIFYEEFVYFIVFFFRIMDDKCGVMWMGFDFYFFARSFNDFFVYWLCDFWGGAVFVRNADYNSVIFINL